MMCVRSRPAGTGSITRRGDRVIAYGPERVVDGKRRKKLIGSFDTYKQADKAIAKWIEEHRESAACESSRP